ncbi:MAG: hypothetical protein OEQ53_04805 [Saprospiraceae bacterium]|nr:hypothetical protein [Saprospiraceae bacterium]
MSEYTTNKRLLHKYESFQFSWFILIFIPAEIWISYLFLSQTGSKPLPLGMYIAIQVFMVVVCLLFYGMKTTMTEDQMVLRYGIGIIRIKIDLRDVSSSKIVRNPWYYGLGIRLIPKGMLYNVSGLNAVELKFKNKERIIRVGSSEVEILKYELDKRIQ